MIYAVVKSVKSITIMKKESKEFVSYVNEGKEVLHDVATFSGEANGIEVDVAFNIMINIQKVF